MGIETLIGLAIAGTVGGSISKANGGSFWKGALIGGLTGGVGSVLDAATGSHLSGGAANRKKELDQAKLTATQAGAAAAGGGARAPMTNDQLLAGNPNVLSGTSNTTASMGRGRMLGN